MSEKNTKPTIEEMEATLNSGHQPDIEILPDGRISAKADRARPRLLEENERIQSQCAKAEAGLARAMNGDAARDYPYRAELAEANVRRLSNEYSSLQKDNERLRAVLSDETKRCASWESTTENLQARIDAELARHKPCHAGAEAPWCPACANNPTAPCPAVEILRGKP